jgi:hypothetical protein
MSVDSTTENGALLKDKRHKKDRRIGEYRDEQSHRSCK